VEIASTPCPSGAFAFDVNDGIARHYLSRHPRMVIVGRRPLRGNRRGQFGDLLMVGRGALLGGPSRQRVRTRSDTQGPFDPSGPVDTSLFRADTRSGYRGSRIDSSSGRCVQRHGGSVAEVTSGAAALRQFAPDGADALDAVVGALWADAAEAGTTVLVTAAAAASADLLGVDPLTPPDPYGASDDPGSTPWDGDGSTVLAFATQSCLDVASVTPDQRADFLAVAGPLAGGLAASLWVVDMVPRTRAAFDTLFGPGPWPVPEAEPVPGGLWGALDGLIRVVPALDALDPVTSEVVRLRGARQHDCRLCRSLRSRTALRAGATESDFDAVDTYADSSLSPLARASLAFCDAMLWTPGRIDPDVVAALQHEAHPDQQVELVLDVTRNALNKVAVALGADAAHVEEGIEIYDVEPDGSLVYGLSPD
jgi:hypothetical protein